MTQELEGTGKRGGVIFIVAVLVFLFGLGVFVAFTKLPTSGTELRVPETADAYRLGGRPIRDADVRRAVTDSLPKLASAANAEAMRGVPFAPEHARIRRELGSPALASALGDQAKAAMWQLVSVYAEQVAGRTDFQAVRAAALRFDDALAARGLAYRIEAIDQGTTTVGLLGFEVEEVRKKRVGESEVLLLLATRVDTTPADPFSWTWVAADSNALVVAVDRADRLAAELGDPSARDRVIASAMHGLAQRYVDLRRQDPIPLPSSVLAFHRPSLVQGPRLSTLNGTTLAVREALASIAGNATTQALVQALLLRCVTGAGRCDRDHENAARIVFGELGRELAVPDLREPAFLGPDDLARIHRALGRRTDDAVAQAAAAAFERLFGDPPSKLQ